MYEKDLYYIIFFLPVMIAFSSIFISKRNYKLSRIIYIASLVFSIPAIFIEYVAFLWIWGGDGYFTLKAIPIAWVILLCAQLLLLKFFSGYLYIQKIMLLSIIFLTPILTCLIVFYLAKLLGLVIDIA